ncbi:MAG: glycosyltransferase family 8 protein, partial [Lachnospiraceae bacterium]|nr:glycosyltransferase family 8 protein [Lachnospiraceae bacterium]
LPIGNGEKYDTRLLLKMKAYSGSKVILLFHDLPEYDSLAGLNQADLAVFVNETDKRIAENNGLRVRSVIGIPNEASGELYTQRVLLDLVTDLTALNDVKDCEEDENVVQIGFGLYDRTGSYSVFVGIVMLSVLLYTKSKVCFHIFHEGSVNENNQIFLAQIARRFGSNLILHQIDAELFASDNPGVKQYSIGCMFRLVMPRVLQNVHKLIYMDADLLVLRDVQELWEMDISGYALAGAHDIGFDRGILKPDIVRSGEVEQSRYINSGVLLMNFDKIREHGDLLDMSVEYLQQHPTSFLPDQDALNYLFRNEILLLDRDWNCQTIYERQENMQVRENVIYHFMGQRIISYDKPAEYDKIYLKYKQETPWGYDGIERELYRGYASLTDKAEMLQKIAYQLSDPKKKRIFYGKNTLAMKSIRRLLFPREGDYCIEQDMIDRNGMRYGLPVKTFEDLAKEEKGTYIVLVLPEAESGQAMDKLVSIGLEQGEDFFSVPRLLLGSQGGYWA